MQGSYDATDKMEYYIVEGKRKLSMLYAAGGRIYQRKGPIKKGIRLRCMNHKSCGGLAFIDQDIEKVFCDKPHTCSKDPDLLEELYFRNTLKRNVIEHLNLQTHAVYNLVLESFNEKIMLKRAPFKTVKPHLCRIRAAR